MSEDAAREERLSSSLRRLRSRQPFFATLALFARQRLHADVPTAATDGRDVFWGREFLDSLSPAEVDGVLLHEVLHAALLHVPRRGARHPVLWNIAADIVVNAMAEAAESTLPAGAVRYPKWAHLAAEEIYELLERDAVQIELPANARDLLDGNEGSRAETEAHWRAAQAQARTLTRALGRGSIPAGFARELSSLEPGILDWRSYLWRYLVRTPTDFAAFDRRLIHRGLYVETLDSESVRVFVCVDTSGSISGEALAAFVAEVAGILRSYPHLICDLYYADAGLDGPHRLTGETSLGALPVPVGGGGTNFAPFFAAVEKTLDAEGGDGVCVYLTDGDGNFPADPPRVPTLWVVTPGGADLDAFPFGEATRLLPALSALSRR